MMVEHASTQATSYLEVRRRQVLWNWTGNKCSGTPLTLHYPTDTRAASSKLFLQRWCAASRPQDTAACASDAA
jgi:hypothetical protein